MTRPILNHTGEFKRHFFECDKGNRWSECEWKDEDGKEANRISPDGSYCGIRGCIDNEHKIKLVKILDGKSNECADFVHNWFRSVYKENIILKAEED